jgi:hypothetical protein
VIAKSIRVPLNLYLFLALSVVSLSVFAGVDPEEANMEENIETEETVVKEVVDKEIVTKENLKEVKEELVKLTNSCISFPEALAFKEHFACQFDIEKLRLARLKWNFTKLIIRD